LEKLGEVLSVGEKSMIESVSHGGTAFSTANESIGETVPFCFNFSNIFYNYYPVHADSSVMKTAATATTQTFGGR
jgi:hypothetical protein